DEQGRVVAPFDREHCKPVRGDSTKRAVTWDGAELSAAAGRTVRFRFHLTRGSFYAFWVTPDAGGASYGYVAGGGPDLGGAVDAPKAE
ncbi:MAG: glycosyl hydrolase family 32, partial [Planctomycetota bacterium]|nr:glycosyl hydrolase family 32 [Planctomycetota bacterium]